MKRPPARNFQDLIVWQKAHAFVLGVYPLCRGFPSDELFGLNTQLKRAAVSIAANIAEGFKKKGRADKAKYLNIAHGSLEECRYYLILVRDLRYGETGKLTEQLEEVSRLLTAYTHAVWASIT